MTKLTLKKIAEITLAEVGHPLTSKEIWEKANLLGTVGDFVSQGKTPDATIAAYIYWSLRDKEGIFTKVEGKPVRFGLVKFGLGNAHSTEEDRTLQNFLETWPLQRVKNMTLQEYNAIGRKDTFCYMLEYGSKNLGNISGGARSNKFEVWERKDKSKTPKKQYGFDATHNWLKRGNSNRTKEEAFEYAKKKIVNVIELSQARDFSTLDNIEFASLVVWKVAFIYSDMNLLSISDRKAVRYLVGFFDMPDFKDATTSEMHKYLMQQVDRNNYWHRMDIFWQLYLESKSVKAKKPSKNSIRTRKGTYLKDVTSHIRKTGIREVVISREHDRLQQNLLRELQELYGKAAIMEEDYIDIKVEHEDRVDLYEVKVGSSALACIRASLGQIIEYSYKLNTSKKKRLIIVGNHPLSEEDRGYFEYLKESFSSFDLRFESR